MQPDPTPPSPGAAPTPGTIDLQAIVYGVCEAEHGGCACKVTRTNLAAVGFGAQPRGARCDERYSVALSVLCAIVQASGDAAAVETAKTLACAPTLAAQVSALMDALRGTERALAAILDNPAFELGTPTMDDVARGSEADRADAITSWDFAVKDGNVALSTARSTLAAVNAARTGTTGGDHHG